MPSPWTYTVRESYRDDAVKIVRPGDVDSFDALVVPVHLPSDELRGRAQKNGIPVITHHRMAGMIARETGRLRGIRSVEITGTYGKTTAAFALSGMLAAAGERVLLHTSHGLFFDGRPVGKRLSVTPASIVNALDAARDAGLQPTVFIAEVSLGGCGTADVGVITTLKGDYPIAGRDIPLLDRQDADDRIRPARKHTDTRHIIHRGFIREAGIVRPGRGRSLS